MWCAISYNNLLTVKPHSGHKIGLAQVIVFSFSES